MGAAREQCRQNHQVPWREKPMFSLISKALGGACDKAQPMTLREIVEMLGANPRKVCRLDISKDLLASFDGYHWFNSSQFLQSSNLRNSDAIQRLPSPGRFLVISMVRTASTWVPEMLNSVVVSRRANTRLTPSTPDGKMSAALSLIEPIYVGHLVCQERAAQVREK